MYPACLICTRAVALMGIADVDFAALLAAATEFTFGEIH